MIENVLIMIIAITPLLLAFCFAAQRPKAPRQFWF